MLTHLLAFEWRYHTKRLTFALVVAVLCFMAFMMASTGFQANGLAVNAPYPVMQSLGLLSLWVLFTQTIFTVNGVLRDDEHGMRDLILSRPIGRGRLLFTRYIGLVLAGFSAMSIATLVLMVLPFIAPPRSAPVASFRLATYLLPLFTVILPNLLFVSAVLACVAGVARTALATYVGGIVLFAVYMVTALLVDSPLFAGAMPATPAAMARAAWLDPFGLSAYFDQTRYWTPFERSTQLVALSGRYLGNRALWLAITGAVLALAYRIVPLGTRGVQRQKAERKTRVASSDTTPEPTVAYVVVTPQIRTGAVLIAAVRFEWKQLLGSWLFRVVLLLFAVVTSIETTSSLRAGEFGTRILASSWRLADAAPIAVFGTLVLIFFAADVVWRERLNRIDGLVDATPTSNVNFLLAKYVGLATIPVVIAIVGLGVAVATHIASGGQPIEPTVYLAQFWFVVYPQLLLAAAVLLLHVLAPNRWIAMLASVMLVVFILEGAGMGAEHPMWRFTAAPGVQYSELDGFGPAVSSFAAFMGWWTTVAALLVAIAFVAWRRGVDLGALRRFTTAWRTNRRASIRPMMIAGSAAIAGGVALLVTTNRAEAWQSENAGMVWKADYERQYRRVFGKAQPAITHVDLRVDFEPQDRRATVRGILTLRNRGSLAIDTVWVTTRRDARTSVVSVANAKVVNHDERFGVWTVALEQPLNAGDSTQLHYELTLDRGGVRARTADRDIASNGSYVTMYELMPTLGYRATYELTEEKDRRAQGLGASSVVQLGHDAIDSLTTVVKREGTSPAWFTFHAIVSTSRDQEPLGPGVRVRSWNEGERHLVEYRVDTPMSPGFALSSGRFDVRRVQHNGVEVELWFHPSHRMNTDRIIDATTRTLDVLGARLGAYPSKTLRMVEIPNGWDFGALAMPGMMFFTENRGMLTDPRSEDVDLLTRRVAHEVAHQWWGHTLDPLMVRGASTLVESLAKDGEQQVVASRDGAAAIIPILAFDHDRYLAGRANEAGGEHTLDAVFGQSYLVYGKGALAMHALRAQLGDSVVDRVLRTLLRDEGGPFGTATTPMLHARLRAEATSEEGRSLVDDWFARRVIHDLRADSAVATVEGDVYRVRAGFRVQRVTTDSAGERVTPADGEAFEVVIYGSGAAADSVLYRESARAHGDRVTVTYTGKARPGAVEIDPRILRIDRERSNNRLPITMSP